MTRPNISPNFKVSIDHTADWWLGNLDDPWFKALEGAIQEEWGVDPLRIREGGVGYFSDVFLSHMLMWSTVNSVRSIFGERVRLPRSSSSTGSEFGKLLTIALVIILC